MGEVRDVVILLPGITGSALAKNGKEVWGTSAGAIWRAVKSGGNSIEDLELPAGGGPDGVTPVRLIPDVTIIPGLVKIDGYGKIEEFLINHLDLRKGLNYFPFPYDWRLDNRVNAKNLESFAMDKLTKWRRMPGNEKARLVLIGHSMGGLISRYFLECLGGWQDTRTLVTLGTPHRGSINAVDFLVNGMKKGVGPLGVDLTPLLRSLPSVYQLLPNYPCVDSGEQDLVGVADAANAGLLPNVDEARVRDSYKFHREIVEAQASNAKEAAYAENGYILRPLVGTDQPTSQSVRCKKAGVEILRSLNGDDHMGDGTVPRISAIPIELFDRNMEIYAAEKHGSLQNLAAALDNIKGFLTKPDIKLPKLMHGGLKTDLSLDVEDAVFDGEPLTVKVQALEGNPRIRVKFTDAHGKNEAVEDQVDGATAAGGVQYLLPPGIWRLNVSAEGANPVNDLVLVAEK